MRPPRSSLNAAVAAILLSAALLSAEEVPAPERVLRSYDLRFLIDRIPQFPVTRWPSAGNLRLADDEGAAAIDFAGILFDDDFAAAGVGLPPEAIVDLIRQNIAEDTWSDSRNRITRSGTDLVVVQTPEAQRRISELLGALRARRARMVTVDVAVVPPDALGDLDPHSAGSLDDGAFSAVMERAGDRGRRISITAYNDHVHAGSRVSPHQRASPRAPAARR